MIKKFPRISPEGLPMILLAGLVGWILAFSDFTLLSFVFFILTIALIFFFRDPERNTVSDSDAVLAPADGKILKISNTKETEFIKKDCLKISIFLSILDCHVNRFPVSGKVLATKYKPGKYNLAYEPELSDENEQLMTYVELNSGPRIVFSQIAGFLARRIVSYADVGSYFDQGERFGIIKFGSRMDLYLPTSSVVEIQEGDKVKAGETILAWFIEKKD
ncbi:MAG: phosphatidylserine decarboxylase family protein [Thermodesulfobacteriota bacterium]